VGQLQSSTLGLRGLLRVGCSCSCRDNCGQQQDSEEDDTEDKIMH
jgi:hypothetical protein